MSLEGSPQAFSARNHEIARAAERFRAKWGREPQRGEIRELALENRQVKVMVTRSDLQEAWSETGARFDFTGEALTAALLAAQGSRADRPLEDRVAGRLTDRAATFEPREFRAVLLEQSVGDLGPSEALALSRQMVAERQVLLLEGGSMTTQNVRDREELIAARFGELAQAGLCDVGDRARTQASDQVAERIGARLSDEQTQALRVVTGPERAAVVIGPAGTGQGRRHRRRRSFRAAQGCETLGIAVSGSTAQRLGRDSPALLDQDAHAGCPYRARR